MNNLESTPITSSEPCRPVNVIAMRPGITSAQRSGGPRPWLRPPALQALSGFTSSGRSQLSNAPERYRQPCLPKRFADFVGAMCRQGRVLFDVDGSIVIDELDTPNCPQCLHPMEAVVAAWWCSSCGIAVAPEGDRRDDSEV